MGGAIAVALVVASPGLLLAVSLLVHAIT